MKTSKVSKRITAAYSESELSKREWMRREERTFFWQMLIITTAFIMMTAWAYFVFP